MKPPSRVKGVSRSTNVLREEPMDIALASLQGGRAIAAGYVLLMVLIVILAILLALIAVLQIVLVVRMGRSGRGEPPAGAMRVGSEPPRAGEAPPTTGPEETPTREVPTERPEEAPPGEPPPTR